MRKKVFVSFADTRYRSSLERLELETENFGFTERYFFTEKDLPDEFFKLLNPKIYRRGYAYWTWKPYLVGKVMAKLEDGDILVYSDGGNHFEYNALPRFEEYLSMMSLDKPILAFQQPYLEKDWTKMDIFKQICPNGYLQLAMTLQLWGGCFILMKSKISEKLLIDWNDIRLNHIDLFTDKKSAQPNLEGFHENRHEQSIFSMLVKQLPHIEISWKDVEPLDGNWEGFENSPIQGKRARSVSKKKKYFTLFYRTLIGLYLIFFKKFYFGRWIAW